MDSIKIENIFAGKESLKSNIIDIKIGTSTITMNAQKS